MAADAFPLARRLIRHHKAQEVKPITVSLKIIAGRNLAPRDPNGLSDPFARISYGYNSFKTKVVRKNLSPVWEETFQLGPYVPTDPVVAISIWDWDYLCPRSDFIGQFCIDLSSRDFQSAIASSATGSSDATSKWYTLEPRANKNDGPVTGEVQCAVIFHQNITPCAGWLLKKGGVRRNWKKRWFVLYCEEAREAWSLIYFASKKDFEKGSKALGSIPLSGAALEANIDEKGALARAGEQHVFSIHTIEAPSSAADLSASAPADSTARERSLARSQLSAREEGSASRVFELRAESREDYENWVRQLEPLIPPVSLLAGAGAAGAAGDAKLRARLIPVFEEPLADVMSRQRAAGFSELIPLHCAEVIARIRRECTINGIFRIAGTRVDIDNLVDRANSGKLINWDSVSNVHNATGFFKHWLRELSEPVMTYDLYTEFITAIDIEEEAVLFATFRSLLGRLPSDHYNLLKEVMRLCADVAEKSEVNLMTAKNVAIVMSPNLMWDRARDIELAFSHLTPITSICRYMIENFAVLFEAPARPVRPPLRRKPTLNRSLRCVDEARKLFQQYDYDNSGSLDQQEFWAFFSDVCQSGTTPEIATTLQKLGIAQCIRLIDSNGDGMIDREEFLSFWTRLMEGDFK